MKALFQNRTEAGMAFGELLGRYAGPDTLVLGIDREGTMVAAELAHWLGTPFDLLPVEVFALPCDRGAQLGAVAPGGSCVLDDELVDRFDVPSDAVGTLRRAAEAGLEQRSRQLRGERSMPELKGRIVLLVDDCVASTLRMRAAILCVQQLDPRRVVVVAPVMTQAAVRELATLAGDVVAIETSERVPRLEDIYAEMEAPSDDAVRRVLGVVEPQATAIPREAMND